MRSLAAALVAAIIGAGNSPAQPITWNDPESVVAAAMAASPSMRAARSELEAARARERAAGTLPNPELIGGVENQQIDLSRDPMMTMYVLGASQTFVRGERRDVLRHTAALEVGQRESEARAREAEIRRDVLLAWNDAAAAQNQIGANEEIARLAGTISEAARIRYETGSAAQSDIIRAKVEQNNVRHEVLMERSARAQALARLRALLQLEDGVEIPSFTMQHAMTHHERATAVSLDEKSPAITALEAQAARAEEEIRIAKLSGKPDWNLEASYGFRPEQKDMFTVMGRIELPVRKATNDSRVAEAVAKRDATRADIDLLKQRLRSDLGVAVAKRDEAIDQIELHVEQLVPEAKLAFESAVASYQTGKTTFDAVLGALQSYRMLNVDYFEFLRQLAAAQAQIDAIQHGATMRGER